MMVSSEAYISVDIEASGPIPGQYSMLSIGACDALAPQNRFSCELKPISQHADPKAMEVSGYSLMDLQARGLRPADAMKRFSEWVETTAGSKTPVFVGLNAPFDWSFVNYYFHRYMGANPFGFSALDIKALYMGAFGGTWKQTSSSAMRTVLSVDSNGTHNALEDAIFQAELFRAVLSRLTGHRH